MRPTCWRHASAVSRVRKIIGERRKIAVAVLALILVLILANFFLAFLFGDQIRSTSPFAFGTDDKDTFISLVFLEGGVVFGLGAFLASGIQDIRETGQTNARNVLGTERTVSQVPRQKKKLMSAGTFLMLVGSHLLAISVFLAIVVG
jgi:hypothetical protein